MLIVPPRTPPRYRGPTKKRSFSTSLFCCLVNDKLHTSTPFSPITFISHTRYVMFYLFLTYRFFYSCHDSYEHPHSSGQPFSEMIKGASFIASNCAYHLRNSLVVGLRDMGFRVDGLGRCLNTRNITEGVSLDIDENEDILSDYKTKKHVLSKYMFHLGDYLSLLPIFDIVYYTPSYRLFLLPLFSLSVYQPLHHLSSLLLPLQPSSI